MLIRFLKVVYYVIRPGLILQDFQESTYLSTLSVLTTFQMALIVLVIKMTLSRSEYLKGLFNVSADLRFDKQCLW